MTSKKARHSNRSRPSARSDAGRIGSVTVQIVLRFNARGPMALWAAKRLAAARN